MTSFTQGWKRVETEEEFRRLLTDRVLTTEGATFTLHANGQVSGLVEGCRLRGSWHWADGCFCRTAELDGEDLGQDCEIIEVLGNRIRYTRDRGNGEATIAEVGPRQRQ